MTVTADGGDLSWTSEVTGTFYYGGATGWMQPEGAAAMIQTTGAWAGSEWSVQIDGVSTDGSEGVQLDEVTADSTACDGQPSGGIGLRGESGYWYHLDLSCGCGTVVFHETEELGTACVDLSGPIEAMVTEMRP